MANRTSTQIYNDSLEQPQSGKKIRMIQDWLYAQVRNDFKFWPIEWVMSYKMGNEEKTHD